MRYPSIASGSRLLAGLAMLVLAGCQQLPIVETISAPAETCPPVVVNECPVCEARACPAPQLVERVVRPPPPAPEPPALPVTAGKLNLPVIGAVEWVRVEPPDLRVEGRMDTGVELSVLQVDQLTEVEKDGERYAVFSLPGLDDRPVTIERPLLRRALVRGPAGDSRRAPVVRLWLSLGENRDLVEVGLSDGGKFEHRLVVGRNFLTDLVIVDVSQRYSLD